MTDRHSPAPWGFLEADHHDEPGHRYRPLTIHDAENNDLANLYDEDHANGPTTTREQAIANAHLMAAAPDLLAAARVLDGIADPRVREAYSRAFWALRNAIAKAEGK